MVEGPGGAGLGLLMTGACADAAPPNAAEPLSASARTRPRTRCKAISSNGLSLLLPARAYHAKFDGRRKVALVRWAKAEGGQDGEGSATIEQGSPQAEKGENQDHRRQAVAEGRSARIGESEERLGALPQFAALLGRAHLQQVLARDD